MKTTKKRAYSFMILLSMLAGCLAMPAGGIDARAGEIAYDGSITPVTTSGTPGYTASGFTSAATDYSKSFDGTYKTIFDGEKAAGYAIADFGRAFAMSSVKVYPRVDSNVANMNRVNGLTFYGSTDGSEYTKIVTLTFDEANQGKEGYYYRKAYESADVTAFNDDIYFNDKNNWITIPLSGTYRYMKFDNADNPLNLSEVVYYTSEEPDTPAPPPVTDDGPTDNLLKKLGTHCISFYRMNDANAEGLVDGDSNTMGAAVSRAASFGSEPYVDGILVDSGKHKTFRLSQMAFTGENIEYTVFASNSPFDFKRMTESGQDLSKNSFAGFKALFPDAVELQPVTKELTVDIADTEYYRYLFVAVTTWAQRVTINDLIIRGEIQTDGEEYSDYELIVSDQKGVDIQDNMYGLFFEDLSYGADGGLYAEMIENRSFESRKWIGGDEKVTPDYGYGWSGSGTMEYRDETPMNENNTHYLHYTAADEDAGFVNQAYEGVYMEAGKTYHVSAWMKSDSYDKEVTVSVSKDGTVYASGVLAEQLNDTWTKYSVTLTPTQTVRYGDFTVSMEQGEADFDMISCIPDDAVLGVFRKDLAEKLKALHPGFMRFPGGCVIEGGSIDNTYRWKDGIGPVEERKQNWNVWANHVRDQYQNYNQTYGIGYYEYFLLCEYLNCDPLPVMNAGMACQYASGAVVPLYQEDGSYTDEFMEYVQDVLDLIDFANGTDPSNEWVQKRISMGREEPFHLKYIAIGNEQWNTSSNNWYERYEAFEKFIHASHPEIQLISSAGPGVNSGVYTSAWKWIHEKAAENPSFAHAVDEHYYNTPDWFYGNDNFYDSYDRSVKVFAGEYASRANGDNKPNNPTANNLNTALSEAAFMTGLERNADVVYLASYAPLFARYGYSQWSPNMIWFNDMESYATTDYYVQYLYSNNNGDYTLQNEMNVESDYRIYQTTCFDEETGDIIIKLVNRYKKEMPIDISLPYEVREAEEITLSSDTLSATNTFGNEVVAPVSKEISVAKDFTYNIQPYTFAVLRIHTDQASIELPEGDVNGDREVTSADALLAVKAANGSIQLTENEKQRADRNGDQKITLADAILILKLALQP